MVDSIQNNQGAVALDINQLQNWLRGDTIVSGVAPSAGGSSLEVDVATGTARVGGSNVSVSQQTATLSSGGSNPRKDLVYIDSGGNVQVAQGTGASARPSGSVRFDTYQPAPPDSTGITGAVVCTVWVASGKSGVFDSADIRDRRLLSALDLDSVTVDDLDIGTADLVASGDVLPLFVHGPTSDRQVTTSSSTYGEGTAVGEFRVQWDQLIPTGAQGAVNMMFEASTDSTTIDVRYRNNTDGENVVESTGLSLASEFHSSGWTNYTPTTTDSPVEIRVEFANGDNATTVTLRTPVIYVGIQL